MFGQFGQFGGSVLKGTKRQHSGQMSQIFKTIKTIQKAKLRYVAKYKVRKMAKSLLKHHCCCPMLSMRTTKTAVCLQTKAICHHLYGFQRVF